MLITPQYKELNQLLYRVHEAYGTTGHRYAKIILRLMEHHDTMDVLDYGCGRQTLEKALGVPIHSYDPCIPGLDATPAPHDIVACTDVLEHIEPDCLENVLLDIRRVTKICAFLLVATRPAMKTLQDGRNAHLIQQPFEWWAECFSQAGFTVGQQKVLTGAFAVVVH